MSDRQTVKLDYFKPDSGGWYGYGDYVTEMTAPHQIIAEVKFLKQRKELPGLMVNHSDFTVLISFNGGPQQILYGSVT
jgi:hypothetical protein